MSCELKVLKEYTESIQDVVMEPLSIAARLYSKEIIDRSVYMRITDHGSGQTSYDKAVNIVQAIEAKLIGATGGEEREVIFTEVLDAMSDYIPLDSIAERMKKRYHELKLTWVEPEATPTLNTVTPAKKLKDVINELNSLSDKWRQLGIQLDVPMYKLKSIDNEYRKDEDKLIDTLDYWMNNNENNTWECIIIALSASVEGRRKAMDIKRKYIDCN